MLFLGGGGGFSFVPISPMHDQGAQFKNQAETLCTDLLSACTAGEQSSLCVWTWQLTGSAIAYIYTIYTYIYIYNVYICVYTHGAHTHTH